MSEQIQNNNNSEIQDISEDYKFNFDKIFRKLKSEANISKNKNNKNNKNAYYCNLLMSCLNLTPIKKIDYLELLYSFNSNKNDNYYIFQKITNILNLLKYQKNIDFSKYNDILINKSKFLEEEKNYFYSFFCLSDKKSIIVYNIKERIKDKISSLIEEQKKYFEELKKEEYIIIKDILNNIEKEYENIEINENLYVINKIWVKKAKEFIDNIISLDENEKKNKLNEIFYIIKVYKSYISNNDNLNIYYPGPIDNYYITDYKDVWFDNINEDENYLIKKNLILGKDYYLMKEKDWNIIKDNFGYTNDIIRKKNNLELIKIKVIIFDKRIIKNKKYNLLKPKYIQIGKKVNIEKFKEKIINCLNYEFEKDLKEKNKDENSISDDENINSTNDKEENKKENNVIELKEKKIEEETNIDIINGNNKEKIHIYKLSKKNKKLLVEIYTSFINEIPKYESINIEKIDLKDDNPLEKIFDYYNKSNDILLIEIIEKDSYQFLFQKEKNEKNLYQCSICNNWFPYNNKYKCDICHMSFYCSKKCAESPLNKYHIKLHDSLNEFITKKFNINDFLKLELDTSKYNDGLVGLNNLGNTCFINSSLQCLFNTYDLSKYFLSNYFIEEINKKNSQGYNGIMAEGYANLLLNIKTTINSTINPISFIKIFFMNNNSINLRGQQDAQEFLSILLDSLHEDLNRISKKPYIELEEQMPNEKDFEASKRWWDSYKKREDSIIIDLFHGQFKSKIICNICNKSSITYDPFIFLGLPIPQVNEQIIIKFFFGNRYNFFGINLYEKTTILDLKKRAIDLMRIKNYKRELSNDELYGTIEIVQIDKNKIIRKIINNKDNQINDRDLLSSIMKKDEELEIVLYEKKLDNNFFNIYVYPMKGDDYDNSSYPIAIPVTDSMKFKDIIDKNRERIMSLYTNLHKDEKIIVGLIHKRSISWFYFFINALDSKEECPLCVTELNFCKIYEIYSYGDILKKIKKKDKYYDLPLFVMGNSTKNLIDRTIKENKFLNNGVYFLNDCLKLFCEEELLSNDNLWYCNKCKKHNKAKKQIKLYKLPLYLIIQLKKFKNSSGIFSASNEKKEVYINYPLNDLDISDYIEDKDGNKEKYDLYGVIEHHGQISQGHYTSICKINDKWYLFNDEKTFLINNPISKDAYLLFYKKKLKNNS